MLHAQAVWLAGAITVQARNCAARKNPGQEGERRGSPSKRGDGDGAGSLMLGALVGPQGGVGHTGAVSFIMLEKDEMVSWLE